MSPLARVDSIAALKQFRASLCQFAQTAAIALEEMGMDIQGTHTWLQQDQHRHWKARVQDRSEAYTRAKLALQQRLLFERSVQGVPSSCVDERKALRAAEQRFRDAEQRFSRVRSWILQMDRELNDYKGRVKGLAAAVQVEIPNAVACLDRMVDSLEAYVALTPPEAPRPTEQTSKEGVLWSPSAEEGPSQTGEAAP